MPTIRITYHEFNLNLTVSQLTSTSRPLMRRDFEQDKERAYCDYKWLPYALLIFHYYVIGNRILQTLNLPHQFMDRIVVRLEETEEAGSLFIVTWRIKLLICHTPIILNYCLLAP